MGDPEGTRMKAPEAALWMGAYVVLVVASFVECLARSIWSWRPLWVYYVPSLGALLTLLVVVGVSYRSLVPHWKDRLPWVDARRLAIMMLGSGLALYICLSLVVVGGTANWDLFLSPGAAAGAGALALFALGAVAVVVAVRGLRDIRNKGVGAAGTGKDDPVTEIARDAHIIAVVAAAYAFVATALIVTVAVFLDSEKSPSVKQQLSTIWVGVLASIATSIVVLAGTYLATFSDLANGVNAIFKDIKQGVQDVESALRTTATEVKQDLAKAGEKVKTQVDEARGGVTGATDVLCQESHTLSRQLVSLTTADRVNRLPRPEARPTAAMNGAGSLHTAVLDAALNGALAERAGGVERLHFGYARAGISGMLGAYLNESAYDVVGGSIVTNVENYANVMAGAATAIAESIESRKRDPAEVGKELVPFFLINAVVSPAHSLNWPWYTRAGCLPLRFAPDFLLRFMTEVRWLSARKDFLHGRLVTCEPKKTDDEEWSEHVSFPSPPWLENPGGQNPAFSVHTPAEKGIEREACPFVAKLRLSWPRDVKCPFIPRPNDDPRYVCSQGTLESVIGSIAEDHGMVAGDNSSTLVAVWPLARDSGASTAPNFPVVCGTSDCPFCREAAEPPGCVMPILTTLGLWDGSGQESDDNKNRFGTAGWDRAKRWRVGNSGTDWLWGGTAQAELRKLESLIQSAATKEKWNDAASMILDIVRQLDTARWTFTTDHAIRTIVRGAQRCLLVATNWMFHKAKESERGAASDRAEDASQTQRSVPLNEWFAHNLASFPELAAIWDVSRCGELADDCLGQINPASKDRTAMTVNQIADHVGKAFRRHFALAGVIELPKDMNEDQRPSKIAEALRRYAVCLTHPERALSNGADPAIIDLLLIEATTGRPWRVAEVNWRHGRRSRLGGEDGNSVDGDGHLAMRPEDAVVVWYYGELLKDATGVRKAGAHPLATWDP